MLLRHCSWQSPEKYSNVVRIFDTPVLHCQLSAAVARAPFPLSLRMKDQECIILLILPLVGVSWSHGRDTPPIARRQCISNRAIVSIVGVSLGGSDIILCIGPGCGASRRCCSHPSATAMAGEESSGPRPSYSSNGGAKLVGWSFGKHRMYVNSFFPACE